MILIIQSLKILNMQNVLSKNKGKEKILINLISLIFTGEYILFNSKNQKKYKIWNIQK